MARRVSCFANADGSSCAFFGLLIAVACGGRVDAIGGTEGSIDAGSLDSPSGTCGPNGATCPSDEYCDHGGTCGWSDALGICRARAGVSCGYDCPGVCGCDGREYCNVCAARSAGVDVDPTAGCASDALAEEYFTCGLPTGIERVGVFKRDRARKLCVSVTLARIDGPASAPFAVAAPNGWLVEWVTATNRPGECDARAIDGESATGATGVIAWPESSTPGKRITGADIDVTITFAPEIPWLSPTERMLATGMPSCSD